LAKRDFSRHFMMWPRDSIEARLRKDFPDLDGDGIEEMLCGLERLKEADPLVALVPGIFDGGEDGGQLQLMKLAPNFEIAMYLAQATGAAIVTDSPFRWREVQAALRPRFSPAVANLTALANAIGGATFLFPDDASEIAKLRSEGGLAAYPALIRGTFRYLSRIADRGAKPNWEAHAAAHFAHEHDAAQAMLRKRNLSGTTGRLSCAFPAGGIQDNTVNRLLLMSSSEHHLPSVPMAFFIDSTAEHKTTGDAILANVPPRTVRGRKAVEPNRDNPPSAK
jgi:hypothetical protein